MCVISNSGCGSRTRATHNYSGPSVTTRHGQLRFVVARLYSLRLSATIPYCLPVVGSINLESFGFFSKKNTHTHKNQPEERSCTMDLAKSFADCRCDLFVS
jgi:hypothetical protein